MATDRGDGCATDCPRCGWPGHVPVGITKAPDMPKDGFHYAILCLLPGETCADPYTTYRGDALRHRSDAEGEMADLARTGCAFTPDDHEHRLVRRADIWTPVFGADSEPIRAPAPPPAGVQVDREALAETLHLNRRHAPSGVSAQVFERTCDECQSIADAVLAALAPLLGSPGDAEGPQQ